MYIKSPNLKQRDKNESVLPDAGAVHDPDLLAYCSSSRQERHFRAIQYLSNRTYPDDKDAKRAEIIGAIGDGRATGKILEDLRKHWHGFSAYSHDFHVYSHNLWCLRNVYYAARTDGIKRAEELAAYTGIK